jgi:hypothetical protein
VAKFYYAKSGCYKPTPLKRNLTPETRMCWERALGNLLGVLLHAPRLLRLRCGDSTILSHLDDLTASHSLYSIKNSDWALAIR